MGNLALKTEGPADCTEPSELENMEVQDYWAWSKYSLCSTNPRYFTNNRNPKMAKFMCDMCPVKAQCLLWALIYDEEEIWGGLSKGERTRKYTPSFRERLIEKAKRAGMYYSKIPLATYLQEYRKRVLEQSKE